MDSLKQKVTREMLEAVFSKFPNHINVVKLVD